MRIQEEGGVIDLVTSLNPPKEATSTVLTLHLELFLVLARSPHCRCSEFRVESSMLLNEHYLCERRYCTTAKMARKNRVLQVAQWF